MLNINSSARYTLLAALTGLLAACASSPPEPVNPNAGRYSIQQDRAPSQDLLRIEAVPEVIPGPLRRTAAGNRSPYTVLGKTYRVLPSEAGYREQGVASWYGEKFHGHRTSNGEVFDMYQFSAAHKSLPIPSFLRVTNLDNNRSLIVRVNDRGPFHEQRVVDLSYAAAVKLGYADRGTARVLLEAIVPEGPAGRTFVDSGTSTESAANRPAPVANARSYVQVGAFSSLDSARALSQRLQGLTELPVLIRSVETAGKGTLHRVRIGPVADDEEIRRLTRSVVAAKLGSPYTVTE